MENGNDSKLLWAAGGFALGAILFTQQGRQIAQSLLGSNADILKSLLPATELAKKETDHASSPQS